MKITGTISSDHVIFNVLIPLVDIAVYQLFAITPVPMIQGKEIMLIKPSHALLAFNAHQDQFFSLSRGELSDCSSIQNNTFLCQNIQKTFSTTSNVAACETKLFMNETTNQCQWVTNNGTFLFMPTYFNDRWIFGTINPKRVSVVCDAQTTISTIVGAGTVDLEPGCSLKIDSMSVYAHQAISLSPIHQRYRFISLVQLNNTADTPPLVLNSDSFEPTQIDESRSIQRAITQLKVREPLVTYSHHVIVSYTSLAMSSMIIVAVIYVIVRRMRNHSQAPIPTPRHTLSPHDFDVTVS